MAHALLVVRIRRIAVRMEADARPMTCRYSIPRIAFSAPKSIIHSCFRRVKSAVILVVGLIPVLGPATELEHIRPASWPKIAPWSVHFPSTPVHPSISNRSRRPGSQTIPQILVPVCYHPLTVCMVPRSQEPSDLMRKIVLRLDDFVDERLGYAQVARTAYVALPAISIGLLDQLLSRERRHSKRNV